MHQKCIASGNFLIVCKYVPTHYYFMSVCPFNQCKAHCFDEWNVLHTSTCLILSSSFVLYLNTNRMECVHESQLLGDDAVFLRESQILKSWSLMVFKIFLHLFVVFVPKIPEATLWLLLKWKLNPVKSLLHQQRYQQKPTGPTRFTFLGSHVERMKGRKENGGEERRERDDWLPATECAFFAKCVSGSGARCGLHVFLC